MIIMIGYRNKAQGKKLYHRKGIIKDETTKREMHRQAGSLGRMRKTIGLVCE